MRSPLSTAIAIAIGLILLVGYFLPIPELDQVRAYLLDGAIILGGVAGLVAILNLLGIHWRRLRAGKKHSPYSAMVLIGFLATLAAGLALGPAHPQFQRIVTSIQIPVEASLLAVIGISLAFAGMRLLQRRRNLMSIVFIISALVFLLVSSGLLVGFGDIPLVRSLLSILDRLPLAGARGILLGVALGSLTAGLRVLLGADRPYSG